MEAAAYDELYFLEPTHWWYQGMRTITEKILKKYLTFDKPYLTLDAGCGVGGNVTELGKFGKAFGIDYSPMALGYACKKHQGVLARADVNDLPYATDTFDLVTSFDVLYAQEVVDDQHAINEISRVTKMGGHVLIRVPAMPILRGSHDEFVHGIRRYTNTDLTQKMIDAGLRPVYSTYANTLLLPFIYLIRKLQLLTLNEHSASSSDVKATPSLLNSVLIKVLQLEANWIAQGRQLPAGVSLFCLAEKQLNNPASH